MGPAVASNSNPDGFLNLGLGIGAGPAQSPAVQPSPPGPVRRPLAHGPCSRCLSWKHDRPNCQNKVRCSSCFRLGHIALNCRFPPRFPGLTEKRIFSSAIIPDDWSSYNPGTWFRASSFWNSSARLLDPPAFASFGEFCAKYLHFPPSDLSASTVSWNSRPTPQAPPPPTSVPLRRSSAPPVVSDAAPELFASFGEWVSAHSGSPPPASVEVQWNLDQPPVRTVAEQFSIGGFDLDSRMAYHFVDPSPFMPPGGQRVMIPNRKVMTRVVLGRPRRNNSDVAIVTIAPFPEHQVSFSGIRDVLDDFLRNHKRVGYRTIQPCPFGQAYVKFRRDFDRDFLIQGSPHNFGNVSITFTEHNKGWNNAVTTMNYEVWLMLLGFNIDYWEQEDVEKAVADFGTVLSWQEDSDHLARIIVKARVTNLTEIPWFIVCSEGANFEGDCWTAQCEILQTHMLGVGAQDEVDPPEQNDLQPNFFEFFGYGQPGNGPNGQLGFHDQQLHNNQNVQNAPNEVHDNDNGNMADGWGLWPNAQNPIQQAIGPNMNPLAPEPFLEMNDLVNNGGNNVVVDLNFPPPEDMGGLDELIPEAAEVINQDMDMEQVIVEDNMPEIVHIPALNDENVEVGIFIQMDNVQPLPDFGVDIIDVDLLDHNPKEEVPVDLGIQENFDVAQMEVENQVPLFAEPAEEVMLQLPAEQQNLHLGFVELVEPAAYPVFSEWLANPHMAPKFAQHPDAVRLWAKHLSPVLDGPHVEVPAIWSSFFTVMLLNPTSLVWAKQLLLSKAWDFFQSSHSVQFATQTSALGYQACATITCPQLT